MKLGNAVVNKRIVFNRAINDVTTKLGVLLRDFRQQIRIVRGFKIIPIMNSTPYR